MHRNENETQQHPRSTTSGPDHRPRRKPAPPPPPIQVPTERVALLVDGINLWYAQQKLNYRIDYIKLKDYWCREEGRKIYNAFFYTGHHAQPEEEKQQFLDMLVNNGFTLRTKTVKTMYDPLLKKDVYKCNLDVEIVIDMLTTADLYDVAVLVSGDGDFERAVEVLRARGKQVFGCCCKSMTARDLVSAVDRFYWLEDIRSELEYKGGGNSLRFERRQEEAFAEMKI